MSGIAVAFGTGGVGNSEPFKTDEQMNELFDVLEKYDVKILDSAQLYGESENVLGRVKAGERFTIDTKWLGGFKGQAWASKEKIISTAEESIKKLGVPKVDIFYMHSPDKDTPLEETLEGINEVYKKGLFKRFGLSNYRADDVQKAYDIAKSKGYVLPTVYQGNYSPVARLQDTVLFPTLRKLGIAFYAYSPLAGGFLAKTKAQITDGAGRFNKEALGGMYLDMYGRKQSYVDALEKWEAIAKEAGCSKADLAYRWVAYNSPLKKEQGDALIVGASKLAQLEQTLDGLKAGPLPSNIAQKIDELWEGVKHDAPYDNFNRSL